VPLFDELDLALRYLAIEQVRFGPRLRLRCCLDPLAEDARLPPLLLQPLVENAVRHGVEPSPEGARIEIHTEHLGNTVHVDIINTLPAGPGDPGLGMALHNIEQRLLLLHEGRCRLSAQQEGDCFRVRLEIPA